MRVEDESEIGIMGGSSSKKRTQLIFRDKLIGGGGVEELKSTKVAIVWSTGRRSIGFSVRIASGWSWGKLIACNTFLTSGTGYLTQGTAITQSI